jgi:hypothetical protein
MGGGKRGIGVRPAAANYERLGVQLGPSRVCVLVSARASDLRRRSGKKKRPRHGTLGKK